jgi:hypothetical protein
LGRRETLVNTIDRPTYQFTPTNLPFNKGPVSCPASHDYVGGIKHVEMAELQIFTDVVIDTGNVNNRRAFITDTGKPAPMHLAAELMGKEPEIKLHGSGNWKLALDTSNSTNPVPRLKGTAIGTIKTYLPNPNLYGKQGDPQ